MQVSDWLCVAYCGTVSLWQNVWESESRAQTRGVSGSETLCERTWEGGWRTALTGDSWWDIIRVDSLATKHPLQTWRLTLSTQFSLIPKCSSLFLQVISSHSLLTVSNIPSLVTSVGAIPPTLLPRNTHTTRPPHLLFLQWLTGCFRCVSMCVCIPLSVWVWLGRRRWPFSPGLSALKQSSFEMTSEQKPVFALPLCHTTILRMTPWLASSRTNAFPPMHPPYLLIQLHTILKEANTAWSTPSIPCY